MADDVTLGRETNSSVAWTIEGQFIGEKAQAEINKFSENMGKSLGAIEKTLQGLGVKNTSFVNSFKGYAEPLGKISSLTKALGEEATAAEHGNQKYQLREQKLKLVGKAMEDLSKVFVANFRRMSEANEGWEKFRLMNVMTTSEMNRTVGAFEKTGAAALMSSKETGSMVAQFKELGVVITKQNMDLIKTTGQLATVFNVDLGRATQFMTKQFTYLGLANKDLRYLTGQLIPTMKVLGLTGEEALQMFEVLGPTMSLVYSQGTEKANEFQRQMFRLTGVMKGMGLESSRLTETIGQTMRGETDGIRKAVAIGSLAGKNFNEIMREMYEEPAKFALTQEQAFETWAKRVGAADKNNFVARAAAIKFGKEQLGMSEQQMLKSIGLLQQNKSLLSDMTKDYEEARKKEEEEKARRKRLGSDELDEAFGKQMSSFRKGWEGFKKGFGAFWDASLRPILGKLLGLLGDLMGKLGSFFEKLAEGKGFGAFMTFAASFTTIAGAIGFIVSPVLKIRNLFRDIKDDTKLIGKVFSRLTKILPEGGLFSKLKNLFGGAKGTKEAIEIGAKTGKFAPGELAALAQEGMFVEKFGRFGKFLNRIVKMLDKLPFGNILKKGGLLGSKFKIFSKVLGKLAFFIEPILMLFDLFSTKGSLTDKLGVAITGSKKGGAMGALSGGLRWASLGALIGSIFPGPGTIIGGIIGAVGGFLVGGMGSENVSKGLSFLGKHKPRVILASLLGALLPGVGAPIGWWLGGFLEGESGQNVKGNIMGALSGVWEGIKSGFSGIIDIFKELGKTFKATFKPLWDSVLKPVVDIFKGFWDVLDGSFGPIVDMISNIFNSFTKDPGVKDHKKTFREMFFTLSKMAVLFSPLVLALKAFGIAVTLAGMALFKFVDILPNWLGWKDKAGFSQKTIDSSLAQFKSSLSTLTSTDMGSPPPMPANTTTTGTTTSLGTGKQAGTQTGGGGGGGTGFGGMSEKEIAQLNLKGGSFSNIKAGIAAVESSTAGIGEGPGYLALTGAADSSASGKYQITRSTASLLNKAYGLGIPREAMSSKMNWYNFIKNKPQLQEVLMDDLIKSNVEYALRRKGKGNVTDTDVAMLHFMGPGAWELWRATGSPLNYVPGSLNISVGAYQKRSGVGNAIVAAEGALITRPTMTLMGEAGPELISPMNKVDNIMTAIIQRAVENAGKTALPTGGTLLNTINSLLKIHSEQLNVQKQMLAQMKSPTTAIGGGKTRTLDDLAQLKWSCPPLE